MTNAAPAKTRFRSRFPEYVLTISETHETLNPFGPGTVKRQQHHGDLCFNNFIAETSDERMIRLAMANEMFEKDFWIENPAEISRLAVPEPAGGGAGLKLTETQGDASSDKEEKKASDKEEKKTSDKEEKKDAKKGK